jgi:hypothetical protein
MNQSMGLRMRAYGACNGRICATRRAWLAALFLSHLASGWIIDSLRPTQAATPEATAKADLRFNKMSRAATGGDLIPDCADALPADAPARLDCERLDRQIQRLEARLAALCTTAGERILRTVADVDGILVKPPPRGSTDEAFHGSDHTAGAYMEPFSGRYYSLWEIDAPQPGAQKIQQYRQVLVPKANSRPLVNTTGSPVDRAAARYALTWRPILDPAERKQGLFGDETLVYDIATNEALGVRRIFYYALRSGIVDEGGRPLQSPHWQQGRLPDFVQTCRNYQLRPDGRYNDLRPRDSYDFVSRILKPKPMAADAAVGVFDLARGKGPHHGSCTFVRFGPHIAPEDLDVAYVEKDSIKIAVRGTRDALLCANYYAERNRPWVHQTELVFYDGTRWTFEDLDRRSGLRAHALAPSQAPASTITQRPRGDVSVATAVRLPAVEQGLWKLKTDANGKRNEVEECGDPLERLAEEASRLQRLGDLGCTIHDSYPSPRAVIIEIDCPADRMQAGTTVLKGKIKMALSSPSPQSFSLRVTRSADGNQQTVEGTRTRACQ